MTDALPERKSAHIKTNENRLPPGGWHFYPDAGSQAMRLEAHDKKTLIDRLFEYRLRNGIATGTEEADIDAYFCSNWPTACNKEAKDYGHPPPKSPSELLLYRVSRWAAGLIDLMPRGGYPLVPPDEAQRRAALCRGCTQNVSWRTGCRGCSASTVSLLNQVRRLQKPPEGLRGCHILGYDNATAVFLPFEKLPVSEPLRQSLPDHCWRK